MPIRVTEVDFSIHDTPTQEFIHHCFDHWKNVNICTDAHVFFMKHLMRSIFRLHHFVDLVGIRFEDDTLVMLSPITGHSLFFVLTRTPTWKAAQVHVNGFAPQWGLETGFWEGLDLGNHAVMGQQNEGPTEDES